MSNEGQEIQERDCESCGVHPACGTGRLLTLCVACKQAYSKYTTQMSRAKTALKGLGTTRAYGPQRRRLEAKISRAGAKRKQFQLRPGAVTKLHPGAVTNPRPGDKVEDSKKVDWITTNLAIDSFGPFDLTVEFLSSMDVMALMAVSCHYQRLMTHPREMKRQETLFALRSRVTTLQNELEQKAQRKEAERQAARQHQLYSIHSSLLDVDGSVKYHVVFADGDGGPLGLFVSGATQWVHREDLEVHAADMLAEFDRGSVITG
jgi:hypothetical protein